ncbi:hypothetical protein BY996DRAFT_6598109 [Phakopsora pachyrhizi]|nr:hypothetical protein BY996DRAFT_6598109 [Phakopsora pachyrhizi]
MLFSPGAMLAPGIPHTFPTTGDGILSASEQIYPSAPIAALAYLHICYLLEQKSAPTLIDSQ